MAEEVALDDVGQIFLGEDKVLSLEVLQKSNRGVLSSVPQNITGWTIHLTIRKSLTSDPPVVDTDAIIVGTYDADRDVNTQRAQVSLTDAQTTVLKTSTHYYSWKRIGEGVDTILAHGTLTPQRTTQVEP